MSELFLKIVNMSISASWLALAVLALRLVLHKAPKWVNVLLWGLVAVRLVCPVSIESALSLIPSAETIPLDIGMDTTPAINSGIHAINDAVNPIIIQSNTPMAGASANPLQIRIGIYEYIWILGIAAMFIYTAVSLLCLRKKIGMAVRLRENIFQSDAIASPFVLGVIRPKIYLPFGMEVRAQEHVIAHERAHIHRKDHWWKPLGFLLLILHWFNPLMWLAYTLLCRDIELACDERVVRELGDEQRADYSQALLACSVPHRMIAACPLAFGEVGVKERVRSVLSYKRPAFWIIVLAVAVCVVAAVCFLTNPPAEREFAMSGHNVSDLDTTEIINRIADVKKLEDDSLLNVNGDNFDLSLTADFDWELDGAIRFFYTENRKTYSAQLRIFPEENQYFITDSTEWVEQTQSFKLFYYLDALKYMPQQEIRRLSPDADAYSVIQVEGGLPGNYERVLTYSQNGAEDIDGWYIHLAVQPMHEVDGGGYNGSGDEVIHLFYGSPDLTTPENSAVTEWFNYLNSLSDMPWDGRHEINLPEFPGVTFRWYPEKIEAVTENGIVPLCFGMPIWNAYFCDITGDGLPELCFTISFGSGMIDNRVVVFDYANGVPYELQERGEYDYSLSMQDGELVVTKFAYNTRQALETGTLACEGGVLRMVNAAPISTQDPLQAALLSAILERNKPKKPDGLYHCASFVELDRQEVCIRTLDGTIDQIIVYGMALHQSYGFAGGAFRNVSGSHIPAAITFEIKDGEYILSEYWTPRDGSYYEQDIREKFPDEVEDDAMDTQKYILGQIQDCYDQAVRYGNVDTDYVIESLFEVIESSPALASNPAAYIEAHPIECRELTYYGAYTLRYCFRQFIEGGQTGLRGQLMASVCDEIARGWGEVLSINESITGQEWFDIFRTIAGQLAEQYSSEEMADRYPASWLLVQMLPQDAEAASTSQAVRHDLTTGDLEVPVGELANYVFYTNSEQISVTVKSDADFQGQVNLLDSSQNNARIQQAAVNTHEEDCLFTALTAARLYGIACDGLEDCTVVINGSDQSPWMRASSELLWYSGL